MHADLGAVVAAEDGPVVDKRHLQPQPGRRDRGAGPCHPSADYDEIELPGVLGLPRTAAAQRQALSSSGGLPDEIASGTQISIAPARKTSQIVQSQLDACLS